MQGASDLLKQAIAGQKLWLRGSSELVGVQARTGTMVIYDAGDDVIPTFWRAGINHIDRQILAQGWRLDSIG